MKCCGLPMERAQLFDTVFYRCTYRGHLAITNIWGESLNQFKKLEDLAWELEDDESEDW